MVLHWNVELARHISNRRTAFVIQIGRNYMGATSECKPEVGNNNLQQQAKK